MKKALLLSLVLVCTASVAFAQGGSIGVYSDPSGFDCNSATPLVGLSNFYVVHTAIAGATAVQFSAPLPLCSQPGYLWLSDTPVFGVTIGNSQSGVAIGYGACLGAPVHVLTIATFYQGVPAGECCLYPVLPDPNVASGQVEAVDCLNTLVPANGAVGTINGNATCNCATIATEESTWGQVKSIYSAE